MNLFPKEHANQERLSEKGPGLEAESRKKDHYLDLNHDLETVECENQHQNHWNHIEGGNNE